MQMKASYHLSILLQGAEVWNEWRRRNPKVRPDLRGIDLREETIQGSALAEGAPFTKRFKKGANLRCVDFRNADLIDAKLPRAELTGALLQGSDLTRADLAEASLFAARISDADLTGAKLHRCDLSSTDMSRVKGLTDAQLSTALGNFQSVRLPYYIREIPTYWLECNDDCIPVFDRVQLAERNSEGWSSSAAAPPEKAASATIQERTSHSLLSRLLSFSSDVLLEIEKKSKSYLAASIIGVVALCLGELLSRTIFGIGWLDHAIEILSSVKLGH